MKTIKTKFVIFCNQMLGEVKRAETVQEVLEGMSKRHKQFWSNIQFKDSVNRTINITREFLDQGMSIDEVIFDWLNNAEPSQLEESIHALDGKKMIVIE